MFLQPGFVCEREFGSRFLEEKIERIINCHLDDQVNLDQKLRGPLWKNQARQVITERILLPIEEMLLGSDLHRITEHRSTAVWRRAQPYDLGRKLNQFAVGVAGAVVEGDADGHWSFSWCTSRRRS